MKLTDTLKELEIHYCNPGEHHHVRDGWIGLHCPWCPKPRGEKGRYRLGIEVNTGRANCWVCGRHSLVSVLMEVGHVSYRTAKELLDGVELRKFNKQDKKVAGHLTKPKGIGPMSAAHKDYLLDRGINPKQVERLWNVQGIGVAATLKWRLFIPITLNGEEVSWTTRSLSNKRTRYISAKPEQETVHLKDTLYGIDLARTSIVVVEGPADVWKIGPGAVATFGLNVTSSQLDIIRRFPLRAICFDWEKMADRRARDLCETLSLFPGETYKVDLDAEDPASASMKEIKQLRKAFL